MVEETKKATESSSGVVTVGCKHPNGIVLRLFRMVDTSEQVMGGGVRKTKVAEPIPGEYVLNGCAVPLGVAIGNQDIVKGGYALTTGVPEAFWNEWLKQNAETDLVKNRIVFAMPTESDARAKSKEWEKVRSGLEPLALKGDPRAPKRIEKADTASA